MKPQGTGPVYFYVEDDLLGVIADRDREDVRGLLIGEVVEVVGDAPSEGERVRMVNRGFFTSSQGYGRGPEDATPEAPRAGGLG